jgi:hypothetical protein
MFEMIRYSRALGLGVASVMAATSPIVNRHAGLKNNGLVMPPEPRP